MNKFEYIYLLKNNLSIYEGNIEEIIENYENIIDEMLDEGLTMVEITKRLGSPAVLAEEIVEELGLKHTQEYQNQTTLPQWAKVLLIISGVILFFPAMGIIMGIIGTLLGFLGATIGLIISGLVGSFAIWFVPTIPIWLKLITTIAFISIVLSILIVLYFSAYGLVKLLIWIFKKIKDLLTAGNRRGI